MEQKQMGWQQIRKTFKSNSKNLNYGDEEGINQQIINNNVRKSFVYQMAKKKIHPEIQRTSNQNKMYKTKIKQSKIPMTVSKLFEKQNKKTYHLIVQNIGKQQQKGFLCSQGCNKTKQAGNKYQCRLTQDYQLEICAQGTPKKLAYYLNFNIISVKLQEQSFHRQSFLLRVNQSLILNFKNDQSNKHSVITQFKEHLKVLLNTSQGKKYSLTSMSTSNLKFWDKYYKSAIQFTQQCETGDIILFRGSHFFGSLQRLFTNSEYDHVGMMIKDPTYGNLIFQSTSNSGVCLASWDQMLRGGLYKYTEQFVWRRLTGINRDFQFKNLIHSFVTENLKKKYYISFEKLSMNTSVLPRSPTKNSNKQEQNVEQGFFCSELVAKTYKNLGLLTRDQKDPDYKASNNFYPYHFTQKFDLKLLKGFLSPQYKIWFDDKRIQRYNQE